MIPRRVQLVRKKGWRMPPNTVKVTRPGRWGNPWKIGIQLLPLTGPEQGKPFVIDRARAVELFRNSLTGNAPAPRAARAVIRRELRGKNLACFCRLGDLCHADVLLEIANAPC